MSNRLRRRSSCCTARRVRLFSIVTRTRRCPAPARQPSVTTDVVYGHKDGLALTFDVHRPAHPNGAGLICDRERRVAIERGAGPDFHPGLSPVEREGIHRIRRETRQQPEVSHVLDRGGHAAVGPLHPSAREGVRRRPQPHWRVWWQRRGAPRAAAWDDGRLRGSVGLRRGAQGIQSRRGGRGGLSAHGSRSMGGRSGSGLQADGCRSGGVLTHSLRLARLCSLAHRARRRRHGCPDGSRGDDARGADEGGRVRVIHSH